MGAIAASGASARHRGRKVARWLAAGALVAASAVVVEAVPAEAAFPGVNGRIACGSSRDGNFEIYTYEPDGSDPRRLTFDEGTDFEAAWSPDGTRIAFMSTRTGDQEVWDMWQDGSGLRQLTSAPGEDRPGTYTPDGSQIAFHSARFADEIPPGPAHSSLEIMIMDADGTDQTRLTDNHFQDSFAHVSPNGERIAFTTNRDSFQDEEGNWVFEFEVYTMAIDGSDVQRVTHSPGEDAHASWSPDGSQLTFHSRRAPHGPRLEIYRMDADGSGDAVRLTNDEVFDAFPFWSPDGTRIAWNRGFPPPALDVFTMDATDGSDQTNITNVAEGVFDFRCDWGRRLPCTVSGAGLIRGTAGDDVICGSDGDDRIIAQGGDDVIYAGAGDDHVVAGDGADTVFGEHGNDRIVGGDGEDILFGDQGDDQVLAGPGDDVASGSEGDDRVVGGDGDDECYGETLASCP